MRTDERWRSSTEEEGGDGAVEGRRPGRREAIRIAAVAGLGLVFGAGVISDLLRRARLHRVGVTRVQMGTPVTITVVHPDAPVARSWVERTFDEIERLEAVLSRYRPESPLARLNRNGVIRDAPTELREVMHRALGWARTTEGAFDPTVAPLLALYENAAAEEALPPPQAVERAREALGWRAVRVSGGAISFGRPGMALTLDGIAKGYVVDRAVATLTAAGANRVIVDAGGDMAAGGGGGPEKDTWQVGLRDPHDARGTLGVVRLMGEAVASSGDYLNTFTADRTVHHILDPRTGVSPLEVSGVTVLAPTAMDADALSTAIFVLGPEEGVALLDRLDRMEGLVVTKSGARWESKGFARYKA